MNREALSPETRADHPLKSLDLSFRHLVGSGEVMGGKQEHLLNACFLSRLQEALCATLWWTEQSKCIRNLARPSLRYRSGIVRFFEFEARFLEPTKVRRARIVQKGLTLREPTSHPSHSHLDVRPETESSHEYHRKADQRATGPPGTILQMTTRGADGRWMKTDHEKGAIRYLAGEFNHAGPSGQQIDRRWERTFVPETARRWAESDDFSGEESPEVQYRFAHDSYRCARLPYASCRNKTRCHGEIGAPRRDLVKAVG